MATIKSFTNLSQSKVLAEILPIESADQSYMRVAIAGDNLNIPEEMQYKHNGDMPFTLYSGVGIPCWSLSALLGVLPSATLDSSDDHHYRVHCNERFTDWYDNPIGCCVAMINRLHEQMIYDFNNR